MNESNIAQCQVIFNQDESVLFECGAEEAQKAYEYAAKMERLGLDIRVEVPATARTLADSLGASREAKDILEQELLDEIDSHNEGSCCFKEE